MGASCTKTSGDQRDEVLNAKDFVPGQKGVIKLSQLERTTVGKTDFKAAPARSSHRVDKGDEDYKENTSCFEPEEVLRISGPVVGEIETSLCLPKRVLLQTEADKAASGGCYETDEGALAGGPRADYVHWVLRDFRSLFRHSYATAASAVFEHAGFAWRFSITAGNSAQYILLRLQMLSNGAAVHRRGTFRLRISVSSHYSQRSLNIDARHKFTGDSAEEWNSGTLFSLDLLRKEGGSSQDFIHADGLAGELVLLQEVEEPRNALVPSSPTSAAFSYRATVSLGYPHEVVLQDMELVSLQPKVVAFDSFLTAAECEHLVGLARPNLKRSLVSGRTVSENRTSWSMFMTGDLADDPVVQAVEKRVVLYAGLTGSRVAQDKEKLQVIRYQPGEEFKPHYDNEAGDCSKRAATVLMFLTDVEAGGETFFPKGRLLHSSKATGFGVKPKKGKAFIFWSRKFDGDEDPSSLHAGARVLKGEKWLASKWLTLS